MENLTAPYKVVTIGLTEEIDAVSFQDAAKQMLTKHGLTSVRSIAVEYDSSNGGTVEYVDCEIVDGKLEYRAAYILDVKDETAETRDRLEFLATGQASMLIIRDGIYYLDSSKLEVGTVIRRYDEIASDWFEGEVGQVSGYDHTKQERTYSLALVVTGYAPSPLQEGDLIEIVGKAELTR